MKKISMYKMTRKVYTFLVCAAFMTATSCDEDFGNINDAWDSQLNEATIPGLFNQLISTTIETGQYRTIMTSWLYQWNQSAAIYSASGYRLEDQVNQPWERYYYTLADYKELERLIDEDEEMASYTNVKSMAMIIMAYRTLSTTLLYGDMPYEEAGYAFVNTDNFRPKYDAQQTVMQAAVNDLTTAMNNLTASGSQVSIGPSDTLFGNNINRWVMFANSLRLRYAMIMREKDPSFADPIISDALAKPLLLAEETISLDPKVIPGLEINRGDSYRGNSYTRMGSTMWGEMSSTNAVDGSGIYDLRCPILFEPNEDDEWVPYPQVPNNSTPSVTGNPYAEDRVNTDWTASRSNFACLNVYYVNDRTIPQIIISGSEISFLKAEIYNRGLAGVAANPAMAESFYNEGITASVNFWYDIAFNSAVWTVNKPAGAEPTVVELNGMLAHPEVAYSADANEALGQIYKQSWIALFHQPFESWNLQRRTNNGTPGVTLPATSLVLDFNRLVYPVSERETNRVNWSAATGGGNDLSTTKLWIQP